MFFRAVALGMIKVDDSKGQPYWTFNFPGDIEPYM